MLDHGDTLESEFIEDMLNNTGHLGVNPYENTINEQAEEIKDKFRKTYTYQAWNLKKAVENFGSAICKAASPIIKRLTRSLKDGKKSQENQY